MAMETDDVACAGSCHRGACVNGTCVCASGWSGNADLLTGDLTAWGGPVLGCTSHLLTLQALWSIAFALCIVALIVIPFAAHQQWQKYTNFHTQGATKYWYQYRPLLFVAGFAFTVLVICSIAAVKIITPRFQRVLGIDLHLTIAACIVLVFGIPLSALFFMEVFATFSKGIRSEMAQSPRWQRGLRVARLLLVLAILLVASCGLYAIAHLFISPRSGRNVRVVVNKLWMGQCAIGTLFGSVALVAFAVDTLRNINHTVRERDVLAKWTRSQELRESVASLRRTRLKIGVLLITVPISTTISGLAELWIGSTSTRQQYGSYFIVCIFVGYLQMVLLILYTYTTISIPSRKRVLQAVGLSQLVDDNTVLTPGRTSCIELSASQQATAASAGAQAADSAAAQTLQDVTVSIAAEGASIRDSSNGSTRGLPSSISRGISRVQQEVPLPPQPQRPQQPQQPQHMQHTQQLHVLVEEDEHSEQQSRSEERPPWDC